MKRKTPKPKLEDVRFLHIYGIPYCIDWENLLPGYSFFLKTTASATEVRKLLKHAEAYYNISLKAHNRNEFGYYGVRVWRMA